MKTLDLIMPELTCTSCQGKLEKFLKKHGIDNFMIDLLFRQVTLNLEDNQNIDDVLKIVKKSGFKFEIREE